MPKHKFYLPIDLQFFAEENDTDQNNENDDTENNHDGGDQQEEMFSKDYVEKLRKEAAKYRTKAKDLESQSRTQQQEMMKKVFEALGINPDPEKAFDEQLSAAQKKAQEAEERANERLIRAEVKAIATELGIVDADAALVLMNRDNVKINDSGDVEGVKDSLETLLQEKPYLKGQTIPPSGGGDFSQGKDTKSIDAQIEEAEKQGNRSLAISLKRKKAFGQNK